MIVRSRTDRIQRATVDLFASEACDAGGPFLPETLFKTCMRLRNGRYGTSS